MTFTEKYFRSLQFDTWYKVKDIPSIIGFAEFVRILRTQPFKPDFEIIIGKYYSTYKLVRKNKQSVEIRKTA